MQTSGIKVDINGSNRLLFDESAKIQEIIKYAVKQAILIQEKKAKTNKIKKAKK